MSRYAKANQTVQDLKNMIDGKGGVYSAVTGDGKVLSDLSKVNVDTENVDFAGEYDLPGTEALDDFETIGSGDAAFPVAWCACGGDWELPLVFVLYVGQKGELRAYIPENGNAYNHEEKCAYGSEDEAWDEDYDRMEPDDPRYVFDSAAMKAAVAGRIVVRP